MPLEGGFKGLVYTLASPYTFIIYLVSEIMHHLNANPTTTPTKEQSMQRVRALAERFIAILTSNVGTKFDMANRTQSWAKFAAITFKPTLVTAGSLLVDIIFNKEFTGPVLNMPSVSWY